MTRFLRYLFWPRPELVTYGDPAVVLLLLLCGGLVLLSFVLRVWRRRLQNPVTKKLSRSWPSALLWFGITGLVLVVSRAEDIQFISMRFLWVAWGIALLLTLIVQVRKFRSRHYEIIPPEMREDPLARYLPRRKKR